VATTGISTSNEAPNKCLLPCLVLKEVPAFSCRCLSNGHGELLLPVLLLATMVCCWAAPISPEEANDHIGENLGVITLLIPRGWDDVPAAKLIVAGLVYRYGLPWPQIPLTTTMSIGSFFKSLVSPEAMGDEIIALQERMYRDLAEKHPSDEPHQLLARVWLSRMAAHGNDVRQEAFQQRAYSDTIQCACLPPPKNARALGLWFIYKERPDILELFPKFGLEYETLMLPIFTAMENGTFMELYRRFNPQMAKGAEGLQSDVVKPPPLPLPVKRYYVYLQNEVKGPYLREQLLDLHDTGAITDDTQCCLEGTEQWAPYLEL